MIECIKIEDLKQWKAERVQHGNCNYDDMIALGAFIETADTIKIPESQYDFGAYADRLWEIAYARGKREALEQAEPKTEPQTCNNCKLKGTTKWCDNQVVCRAYQPKDESQAERQGKYESVNNTDGHIRRVDVCTDRSDRDAE